MFFIAFLGFFIGYYYYILPHHIIIIFSYKVIIKVHSFLPLHLGVLFIIFFHLDVNSIAIHGGDIPIDTK